MKTIIFEGKQYEGCHSFKDLLPDSEPHRNIKVFYKDAAGKDFMCDCSSYIASSFDGEYWQDSLTKV